MAAHSYTAGKQNALRKFLTKCPALVTSSATFPWLIPNRQGWWDFLGSFLVSMPFCWWQLHCGLTDRRLCPSAATLAKRTDSHSADSLTASRVVYGTTHWWCFSQLQEKLEQVWVTPGSYFLFSNYRNSTFQFPSVTVLKTNMKQ